MSPRALCSAILLLLCLQAPVRAQQGSGRLATPGECPGRISERCLLKSVWSDQRTIFGSPWRRNSYSPSFIVPFAAGTAALIASDKQIGRELNEGPPGSAFSAGTRLSHMGSAVALVGFSGSFYAAARLTHNERARETGLIAFEALADSGIVAGFLKAVTQRERPALPDGRRLDDARGRFWAGGADFPSGHAIGVWTLATVFSQRYPDRPAVKYTAYGIAGLVSMSRLTARQHFPSDVVVGSVLGYLIGRYVVRAGNLRQHRHLAPDSSAR